MNEIKIKLDDVHPIEILGINNQNLKIIQHAFPRLKVIARGNEIVIKGETSEAGLLSEKIQLMVNHILRYSNLPEDKLIDILGGDIKLPDEEPKEDGFLLIGNDGNVIRAKTQNQQKLVESATVSDMVFAIAVRALKRKEVKRIIITRPAVEAGENLGFLPGDLKDKIDPYLRPVYDALDDMIPAEKLRQYMENRVIEVAPLAFMRGRTLNNAYVILDEAQNATHTQLKMFLTRMGPNAKFIITGDLTQIDLPRKSNSGLLNAIHILKDIPGISIIELSVKDVVRHKLVKDIVNAYEKYKQIE